jgi:alkylhydroperoxidase family enzyme
MRIQPIEKPAGLKMKIMYWYCRRKLGKVIAPLSVVYTRVPSVMKAGLAISTFIEKGLSIDPELQFLLQTHTAQLNNCAFCVDIGRAIALRGNVGVDRVNELSRFETSDLFSEKEKAALRYVDEVTRTRNASDETFSELKKNFTESEIVEITLLNAIEHYFNLVNLPLEIESDGLCALVPEHKLQKAVTSS